MGRPIHLAALAIACAISILCRGFALAQEAGEDPFKDLIEAEKERNAGEQPPEPAPATDQRAFKIDRTYKRELFLQVSHSDEAPNDRPLYNRHSAGFESLLKFSSFTSTFASFDFQGRLVYRDNFIPVVNDAEGEEREGWFFEYHNVYADFYDVLSPLLPSAQKGAALGCFNLRAGRFYLPLGINLQTDTHGTMLQLSNERNLGFERDWYAGLWGNANSHLNYDLYYLAGSGYDLSFKGQNGLLGTRVSLGNRYLNDLGLEGGVGVLYGQRISKHAVERSPSVASEVDRNDIVDTVRFGPDARYSFVAGPGSVVSTVELSFGSDEEDDIFTQLYECAYRPANRRWEIAGQFRRFWQDLPLHGTPPGIMAPEEKSDTSIIGNLTWYFQNDVAKSRLHWISLNVEQQLERQSGPTDTIVSLQYYMYW